MWQASIAMRIRHKNIARVYGRTRFKKGETAAIVMEYVESNLEQYILQNRLTTAEKRRILLQITGFFLLYVRVCDRMICDL